MTDKEFIDKWFAKLREIVDLCKQQKYKEAFIKMDEWKQKSLKMDR